MSATVVFFHAHPDDEALLTGGTMARLVAAGHRVVLVTATDGARGLADDAYRRRGLGAVRSGELAAAAEALGCARVVELGHPDSGMDGPPEPDAFVSVPVADAAAALAAVLVEEQARALFTYDAAGGYGHRDHVHAHHVGHAAALLAGTPLVYEATVDRRTLLRAVRLVHRLRPHDPNLDPARFRTAFAAHEQITHRVPVGRYAAAKRRAMRAHASQAGGGDLPRTLAWMTALPAPLFRLVLGREWFVLCPHPADGEDLLAPHAVPAARH